MPYFQDIDNAILCYSGPMPYDVVTCKGVHFGGCIDTAPLLGSQIAPKPQFCGHE